MAQSKDDICWLFSLDYPALHLNLICESCVNSNMFYISKTNHMRGEIAFSIATPLIWNNFPVDNLSIISILLLKTYILIFYIY